MKNSNEINLTTVSIIVIFSLTFFVLTFFSTIQRFQNAVNEHSPNTILQKSITKYAHDQQCFISSTTGSIQGYLLVINGTKVCEYIGIPYAQAPIGNLRFKRPSSMKSWNPKVWIANTWPASCVQTFPHWASFMMRRSTNETNEDCLYLNIWTPMRNNLVPDLKTDANQSLNPILFWIHGGGYQFGAGTLEETNGTVLAAYAGAVVVTINYRLNAFGFLNLGDSGIQGNQGLYDQAMALDWVSENGQHFGGNPNEITLWGQGMGGISISIHLVSPLSRNKFKRAIIQTGTMFTSRQMYSNGDTIGEQFINLIGCEDDYDSSENGGKNENSLVQCLQRKSTEEIREVVEKINDKNPISFLFTPYENFMNFSGPAEFKSDLKSKFNPSVKDIMFGFNSDEGSLLLNSLLPNIFPSNNSPNISSIEEAKNILTQLFVSRLNVPKVVLNVGLGSAFSSEENISNQKIVKSMIDFVGNNIFVCPTILYAQEVSNQIKNVSVHLYSYTKRSSYNNLPEWFGTIHNEEVPIMFGHPIRFPEQYKPNEIEFSIKMMNLIGNFAKSGQLNNWPEYSSLNQKYLDINPAEFKIGTGINDKDCSLFEIGMDLA